MEVVVKVILSLLVIIRNGGNAQMHEILKQQNLPTEECTSMMIPSSGERGGEKEQKIEFFRIIIIIFISQILGVVQSASKAFRICYK